jgi:hypothetical protein
VGCSYFFPTLELCFISVACDARPPSGRVFTAHDAVKQSISPVTTLDLVVLSAGFIHFTGNSIHHPRMEYSGIVRTIPVPPMDTSLVCPGFNSDCRSHSLGAVEEAGFPKTYLARFEGNYFLFLDVSLTLVDLPYNPASDLFGQ